MDDKSEFKVGDLVRRRSLQRTPGVGLVIEIDSVTWGVPRAKVKWLDSKLIRSQWYCHQLQRVIKE
jgi:hypothetical protein